ncbi:bifunctional hydroxymethylpyrimidine kinase/phosphomethylpyrimidine kinase [Paenibacillus sp. 481]|uniref:bifunctional hydroxymethylpyrimidine kinase/phosphomethylpyrimidine kinase n=1 Tax=Paenibacillus sp. 481 TaxID=2835869 RepID=UPI001E4A1AB8|nr:bifunctional hydroxymethylpyrimidine kinase/phosphomethylpyrimidine kinase [Paenibacillus sp. 481]UHA73114.1 bifunctional hydroxymethylpyrimidine kinase/phosphomethylpyrimidine kinase [Paenibacillus sp. 481]
MHIKTALTIAGSDSGGGAGIQADIKTFQECAVYGMSAITAVTAQNTLGVHSVFPLPLVEVAAQLDAIADDIRPDGVKTGMLYDKDTICLVADRIQRYHWRNIVVDPVMIAKGGASLLRSDAAEALIEQLLPLTTVVTPNLLEAEVLAKMTIQSREDRLEAARRIHAYGAKWVYIKGGHDDNEEHATDLAFNGEEARWYSSERIATVHTHGTGCTLSAAITASLASGAEPTTAFERAKAYIQLAIAHPLGIGNGHGPVNHWAQRGLYMQLKPEQWNAARLEPTPLDKTVQLEGQQYAK